jgi:hypothetical protein
MPLRRAIFDRSSKVTIRRLHPHSLRRIGSWRAPRLYPFRWYLAGRVPNEIFLLGRARAPPRGHLRLTRPTLTAMSTNQIPGGKYQNIWEKRREHERVRCERASDIRATRAQRGEPQEHGRAAGGSAWNRVVLI